MGSIFRIPALLQSATSFHFHPLHDTEKRQGTNVDKVRRKHAKMLIKKLNIASIDSLCNLLPNLVRAPPLYHVESGPTVLGLGAGGGSDEQAVFEFALEVVFFDVVC